MPVCSAEELGRPESSETSQVAVSKESACNSGDPGGEDPRRRKWIPTPVFLPGEFHRQRSLVATVHGSQRVGHDLSN